jgi:putative nucleotidyltransferase with HDIG domain
VSQTITREYVLDRSAVLPGFPPVIRRILETVNDPDANLNLLVEHIETDPVITGRVLSLANSAAVHSLRAPRITDINSAISMIGTNSVRSIAIACSFASFCGESPYSSHADFIKHSLSVSASCKELAMHVDTPIPVEEAQIAGLLHDIGHLWLNRFERVRFAQVLDMGLRQRVDIETAETMMFDVSHAQIGAWLAEYWALPASLISAIAHHHKPELAPAVPLVALTHIAELLSHALELPGYGENRVNNVSSYACKALGLFWGKGSQELFGRIEARSKYANQIVN